MSIVREGGNQIKGVSMLVRILRPYFRWIAVVCLALLVFGIGLLRIPGVLPDRSSRAFKCRHRLFEPATVRFAKRRSRRPDRMEAGVRPVCRPGCRGVRGVLALLSIFFYHVQLVRPWLIGNHVIVCGLGRRGSKLVQQLRAQGKCVVVIEQDENNAELVYCRQMGAIVLLGRGERPPDVGQSLRPPRQNPDLDRGRRRSQRRNGGPRSSIEPETPLRCAGLRGSRVRPRLQRALKKHRIFTDTNDPFELRLFNALRSPPRPCCKSIPGWPRPPGRHRPHLLIVGLGRLGESLLVQAAAEWRERRKSPADKLHLTVIDRQVELKKDWMPICYPDLAEACDITFVQMDIHFPRFPDRVVLDGSDGVPPVTAAFVCVDSDSLALFTALTLHDCLKGKNVPIVVRMTEQAGLAALISSGAEGQGLIEGVHAVGLLDVACSLDLVLR